jgi:hypothetical protein
VNNIILVKSYVTLIGLKAITLVNSNSLIKPLSMNEDIKLQMALNSLLEDELIATRAYNDAVKLVIDCSEKRCKQIEQMSEFEFEQK